ncbi:unnamed protein product, partial [Prorocentrum cordatum]
RTVRVPGAPGPQTPPPRPPPPSSETQAGGRRGGEEEEEEEGGGERIAVSSALPMPPRSGTAPPTRLVARGRTRPWRAVPRKAGRASLEEEGGGMEVVVVYILGARRIVFLLPRSLLRHLELTVVDHLRQGRGRRAVHRAAHGPATAEHLFDGAAELLGLALVPHLPHDMSNSCCLVRFPECLMFLVFLRSRIGSFRPLMMRLVAFGSTSTFAARFWIVT